MSDAGIEYEFEGNADCALCGALAGTTDSRPIPPPHPNCNCSSKATCDNRYEFAGSSTRYGPGGNCFVFNAEITVTCWDGTEVGISVPIDYGCEGADYDEGFWERVWDDTASEAAAMADGCPDCAPPLVS